MADSLNRAATLKDEGNALFVLKDYQTAHVKYSRALDLDENNAVLFANRAACSHRLRKYVHLHRF